MLATTDGQASVLFLQKGAAADWLGYGSGLGSLRSAGLGPEHCWNSRVGASHLNLKGGTHLNPPLREKKLRIICCDPEWNSLAYQQDNSITEVSCIFSLIFVDYIQYFTAKMTAFQHISTKLNFPSWLTGLLSSPCSFVLSDVQTWICTVCTQDLKPKVLTQYTPIKNNIAF